MSTTDVDDREDQAEETPAEKPKLQLELKIDKPSACERHVTVTIAKEDVARYLKDSFDELSPKAELPGFRPGRAPRKLVEQRFKEQISEQVKSKLLMDSLTQMSDDHQFTDRK